MRGMADFEPDFAYSYFLPRETVEPTAALLQMIWPQFDCWLAVHLELPTATQKVAPNLAAGGFLELLAMLRKVFLQVIMTT